MVWSEWIIVWNGGDLECLQKFSKLITTYSQTLMRMKPTVKSMNKWGEDEDDEVKS
jgi:hypothetical protein